jgi:hypothetical protein
VESRDFSLAWRSAWLALWERNGRNLFQLKSKVNFNNLPLEGKSSSVEQARGQPDARRTT